MGRGGRRKRFSKIPKNRETTRVEPGYIPPDFIEYYREQLLSNNALFSNEEFESFLSSYRITLPHVFRLLSNSADYPQVKNELLKHIEALKQLGFDASIADFFDESYGLVCQLSVSRPQLRKNKDLHPFRDWLHAHTEVGDITRQEFVSMLPPFFLDVKPSSSVLDMCAAPGSKTTQILETLNDINHTVKSSNEKNGFIVANDIEVKRCHTLVHQLNRIDTSKVLVINHPAQYIPDGIAKFDRVLCDVPCSGDGTFRKNPDATKKWSLKNGCGLHSIQRSILIRGLQMLKIGGSLVYSTCSMNPIEDEAVVSSVIKEIGGTDVVEIVNCSEKFPGLKRSHGLKKWRIFGSLSSTPPEKKNSKTTEAKNQTKEETEEEESSSGKTVEFTSPDQVTDELLSKQIRDTMFPIDVVDGIENCMRFFPHQNDTGGFFVTVLHKKAEFEVKVQTTQYTNSTSSKSWREPPFIPLSEVAEQGPKIIEEFKKDYGIKDELFDGKTIVIDQNLFARAEKSVKNVFYLSDQIADIVKRIPHDTLRAVSCGTRLFSYKTLNDDSAVKSFPCFEGADILYKYSTNRIVEISPADMKATLKAGNPGLDFGNMSENAVEALKKLTMGGVIVKCEGTNFLYGGMKRTTNLTLQVKKERIRQEVFKLINVFPELADEEDKIIKESESNSEVEGTASIDDKNE